MSSSKTYKFDPNTQDVRIFAPPLAIQQEVIFRLEALGYKRMIDDRDPGPWANIDVCYQGTTIFTLSAFGPNSVEATIQDIWEGNIAPYGWTKDQAAPEAMCDIDGKDVSVSTIKAALSAYFKED